MLRTHRLLFAPLALAVTGLAAGQGSPDEALRALREGNQRFAAERSVPQPIGEGVRRTLARGQSPFAVVVTCADSQVPPEHLFNTGLGELIVVRTAGHVLGAEAIATIEHAVQHLNVPLCVVLGHEHCDLVDAAIARTVGGEDGAGQLSPAVVRLLERIEPAVRRARELDLGGAELRQRSQEEHAQATASECLRRSELLRRYASVDRVRVVAARYHGDGHVEWLPTRPLPQDAEADLPTLLGAVPAGVPPHVSLRMLRAGHRRFLGDSRPAPDLTQKRRRELAGGQQPLAIVVTGSDSRVSPEHVFDAGLGEIYVVRTAGNTLTDETLASIEFAAGRLGASLLVVMGHDGCELLAAAADPTGHEHVTRHQRALLKSLEPSVHEARAHGDEALVEAAQQNAVRTVREARSRSALLRSLEDQGRFAMLAARYDVATGDVHWLRTGDRYEAAAFVSTQPPSGAPAPTAPAKEHAAGHDDHAAGQGDSHDPHAGEAHAAHEELPLMPYASAPMAEGTHGGHDAHVSPEGHDAHAPRDRHEDLGEHGAGEGLHAVVGEHAAVPTGDRHDEQLWQRWGDPVVVVGLVGIASLLFAAVLALKRS